MIGPLAGKRIGLLTASASRLGGGVFEAVAAQAGIIRSLGGEACIFAIADRHSEEDRHRLEPSAVHNAELRGPAQIGYAPDLVDCMVRAELDGLHLHGIWMYPSRAATLWARRTGKRYAISPHGMLDPWITARGRWKKALARSGYERASWRSAGFLHALTQREADDIRRETGRADSMVIANAGPAPNRGEPGARPPHVVYIGRIHPKKNLARLVEGWMKAQRGPDWRLTIAGWGADEDVVELDRLLAAAADSIHFAGPVYGAAKQALLAGARFTVLPSLSEGLPMAVLEGWAAGTPALMTRECNLPEGFAAGAAIDCGLASATIARALESAMSLDAEHWLDMASAARALAAGPFSAQEIAARWAQAYQRLLAAPAQGA